MRRSLCCATVLSVLVGVLTPAVASAADCVPTVLPNPPGATAVSVTGTDDHGTYAGVATDGSERFGVVWRAGGVERLEGFFPEDLNRNGLMSGYGLNQEGGAHAALKPLDSAIRYLTAGYSTVAAGVNDHGDAVGWVMLDHPVVDWTAAWFADDDWEMTTLDATNYLAFEIDDTGLVISKSRIWRTDGTLVREYGTGVELADLDDGKVAATRTAAGEPSRVVLFDAVSGKGVPLPDSAGGTVLGLENGVVVGHGAAGATMWRRTGATVLPPPAGLTAREASVVNGTGTEAAGISVDDAGNGTATVWRCG